MFIPSLSSARLCLSPSATCLSWWFCRCTVICSKEWIMTKQTHDKNGIQMVITGKCREKPLSSCCWCETDCHLFLWQSVSGSLNAQRHKRLSISCFLIQECILHGALLEVLNKDLVWFVSAQSKWQGLFSATTTARFSWVYNKFNEVYHFFCEG